MHISAAPHAATPLMNQPPPLARTSATCSLAARRDSARPWRAPADRQLGVTPRRWSCRGGCPEAGARPSAPQLLSRIRRTCPAFVGAAAAGRVEPRTAARALPAPAANLAPLPGTFSRAACEAPGRPRCCECPPRCCRAHRPCTRPAMTSLTVHASAAVRGRQFVTCRCSLAKGPAPSSRFASASALRGAQLATTQSQSQGALVRCVRTASHLYLRHMSK